MGFLSETTPSQVAGYFVGAIILALGTKIVFAGGIEEYFNPDRVIESQLNEALAKHPDNLPVLKAIEQEFPLEYDRLIGSMVDAVGPEASPEQVMLAGSRFLQNFMGRHKADFAAAPISALDSVLQGRTAALKQLQQEAPALCDKFADGTGYGQTPPSQEALQLMGESWASYIHTMAAGRRNPELRLTATPTDREAMIRTMQQHGANTDQIGRTQAGNVDGLAEGERCDLEIRPARAIEEQPDSRRALLITALYAPQ